MVVLGHVARERLAGARRAARAATADVTGALAEIFSSVEAIQGAGATTRALAHVDALGTVRRRAVVLDGTQNAVVNGVFQQVANLGTGLVMLAAAAAMRAHAFTVGDFALFATYLMQVAGFTGFVGYLVASYREAGVSFERMIAALAGAPSGQLVDPPRPAPPPAPSTSCGIASRTSAALSWWRRPQPHVLTRAQHVVALGDPPTTPTRPVVRAQSARSTPRPRP